MKTRIITAIVAITILLPVLIFSGTPALPIMLALCSVVAIYEMSGCTGLKKAWFLVVPAYLIAAGMPFLTRYLNNINEVRHYALALIALISLYDFAVLTFSKGRYKLPDVATWFLTEVYIVAGFNAILLVRDYAEGGKYLYLLAFIGAWVTDTFAYFCGRLFGKHKLIPDVSPKKTVEGSIGGTLFCVVAMIVFGLIVNAIQPTGGAELSYKADFLMLGVAGLFIAVVSQIGDLLMSVIKRHYGIKDYGKIFPGHGGVLDRFDSNLAVGLLLAIFSSFFSFFEAWGTIA